MHTWFRTTQEKWQSQLSKTDLSQKKQCGLNWALTSLEERSQVPDTRIIDPSIHGDQSLARSLQICTYYIQPKCQKRQCRMA